VVPLRWTDGFGIAATLLYGIIKDHPFIDANKRTAFLSVLFLLQKMHRCPKITHKELEDFTVKVSEDAFAKARRYAKLVKKGDDPEIRYIAYFLRKNTRQIDKRFYVVTYKELKSILHRYGFDLVNPKNNYIDITRREKSGSILGMFGEKKTKHFKLGQIGFPGWTKQVCTGRVIT